MLNKERLWTELTVRYEGKEFHQVSEALNLHQIIICNGLQNSLSEALLSAENHTHNTYDSSARRCCSAMKRITTFLRSTMSEECLSPLAVLSVGKNLLKSSGNVNEKVA
jgi:hypothetical protein